MDSLFCLPQVSRSQRVAPIRSLGPDRLQYHAGLQSPRDTFDMRRISDHLTEDVTREIVGRAEVEKAEDPKRAVSDQMDRLCPGSVD
jgi:hypothetical protein